MKQRIYDMLMVTYRGLLKNCYQQVFFQDSGLSAIKTFDDYLSDFYLYLYEAKPKYVYDDVKGYYLQQIRDEAHRFGITFHRSLRSKSQVESALTRIKGVGEQTEKRLLIHYGSVPRIAAASVEDLTGFLGKRELAERIHEQLNTND